MTQFNIFSNMGWPSACTYNIESKPNSKCEGGADIEHQFTVEGKPNVWMQKHKEKVLNVIISYAEEASVRCCNS